MEFLVDKGLIVRRRGIGTRVVQSRVRRPLELSSLYDDLKNAGQEPATMVLSNTVESAPAAVAEALGLAEGTPVIVVVRLRSARNQPLARMRNYLPASLLEISTEALENRGLYQLIRAAGIRLHAATQAIGARNATPAEARLLKESRGAAVLTMERIAYDDNGTAVEYGTHIYAASRYSFQMSLLTS
jgi:DNA-binding GntR family transcriptional regulator